MKMTNAIEIAKRMESEAVAFYTKAAENTSHPVGKKMFLTIAEDEKNHLKMLDALIKDLDIKPSDVTPMENIKTVFAKNKDSMSKKVKATSGEMEAFKIAMEMEKEGKQFYEELLASAKTPKEKALFDRLVKEEGEHYKVFMNTYSFMSDTGNWYMWEERSIVEG